MHFCQSRKMHLDPELTLDDIQIEVVPEFKILGLLFDSKLSFIPHINYLSNKCHKALNLLRVVSSMDWEVDRKVLFRLYRSLVRSKLDSGCVVYGSARQLYLRKLDSIHNQGALSTEQFLLFPQSFLPFWLSFFSNLKFSSRNSLSLGESNVCCLGKSYPFTKQALVLRVYSTSLSKILWGKGEIARNDPFPLFPQCFLLVWRTFYHFQQILNRRQ